MWDCGECGCADNYAFREECRGCEAPRPEKMSQEQQQAPKLGGEVQPFAAAQLPAALQPFARWPLGARWAAHTHSSQRERLISCSIQARARSASAKARSR